MQAINSSIRKIDENMKRQSKLSGLKLCTIKQINVQLNVANGHGQSDWQNLLLLLLNAHFFSLLPLDFLFLYRLRLFLSCSHLTRNMK